MVDPLNESDLCLDRLIDHGSRLGSVELFGQAMSQRRHGAPSAYFDARIEYGVVHAQTVGRDANKPQ